MSTVLITGASGFLGRRLLADLASDHAVVAMSRHEPDVDADYEYVQGKFHSFEDLRHLDSHSFDAVVHLGAVTGGCSEEDGMAVNVEGSRRLLRYLVDNGCEKFVMASSIATVGTRSPHFEPLELPIPDDHPCLARNPYGVSKYLMEEVTRYFARQNESIDVINIRLGAVYPDDDPRSPKRAEDLRGPDGELIDWAWNRLAQVSASDAIRGFRLATEAEHQSGVRVLNLVGPDSGTADTVQEIVASWCPDAYEEIDLSHYDRPGHGRDPVFDITAIKRELGWEPEHSLLDDRTVSRD